MTELEDELGTGNSDTGSLMYKLLPFVLLSPLFVGLIITFQGIDRPSTTQVKGYDDLKKQLLADGSSTQKSPCGDRSEKGCPEERR